jgi:hypothetical protein
MGTGGDLLDNWRNLRVGDRIRIVRMASGVDALGYTFSKETRQLYDLLIARGRSVRVYRIDDDGLPWIRCRFRRKNGLWEHHWLAVNDDSWVRVQHRK